jgi:hypothetical protein
VVETRDDKKFFKQQIIIKKDALFDKKVPTWASDLNLIAQVVALQYKIARAGLNVETPNEMNVAGRKHPISFSWCYWDEK